MNIMVAWFGRIGESRCLCSFLESDLFEIVSKLCHISVAETYLWKSTEGRVMNESFSLSELQK
jgi:hypothetical protein